MAVMAGSITFETGGTTPVTIGSGSTSNFQFSATGGSAGSTTGNGGTLILENGGSITISPAALSVAPLGTNGNGESQSHFPGWFL